MSVVGRLHSPVYGRRVRVLADAIGRLLPAQARVLDVGCGDGLISSRVAAARPDITIEGIDVLVRPQTHIPMREFNGHEIPADDKTYDVVMFVDVLHHTNDPHVLLKEAGRVAKSDIVIKDHCRNGWLAGPTLRFMDWVGNAHHGVVLPYNYWSEQQWRAAFADRKWRMAEWIPHLPLYPWWADWAFGRSLHFLARLQPEGRASAT